MAVAARGAAELFFQPPQRSEDVKMLPVFVKLAVGQHSDDGEGFAVECELLANNIRIAGEFVGPHGIAEQHDRRCSYFVIVQPERPAQDRPDPQRRKKSRGYAAHSKLLRLAL